MIRFTETNMLKVDLESPKKESYNHSGGQGSYIQGTIKYTDIKNDKFRMEHCIVTCSGIRKAENDKSFDEYYTVSKYAVYNEIADAVPSHEDAKLCSDILDKLRLRLLELHVPYKKLYEKFNMNTNPEDADTYMAPLLMWDVDDEGKRKAQNPHKSYKLVYGTDEKTGNIYKTNFCDPDGNEIDWEILKNTEFDCIPVIHYRTSYGTKSTTISIQCRMTSAVVVSIRPLKSYNPQSDTITNLNAKNPNASSLVGQQLADMQDFLKAKIPSNPESFTASPPVNDAPITEVPATSNPNSAYAQGINNIQAQALTYSSPSVPMQTYVSSPSIQSISTPIQAPIQNQVVQPIEPQIQEGMNLQSFMNNSTPTAAVQQAQPPITMPTASIPGQDHNQMYGIIPGTTTVQVPGVTTEQYSQMPDQYATMPNQYAMMSGQMSGQMPGQYATMPSQIPAQYTQP